MMFLRLLPLAVLVIEGALLTWWIAGRSLGRALPWVIGLPLGALLHAWIFFLLYVAGLPSAGVGMLMAHSGLVIGLGIVLWLKNPKSETRPSSRLGMNPKEVRISNSDLSSVALAKEESLSPTSYVLSPTSYVLSPTSYVLSPTSYVLSPTSYVLSPTSSVLCRHSLLPIFCAVLTFTVILVGLYEAMRFPTYHWDAFTHWNRRAQQFSQAGTLLMEGTSKPHYPILTHAMGVMTALPAGWDDKMANVANALLSVTLLGSVFLVVRRTHGMMTAAVLLPLLAAMPIAAVHLRGGMADLPVACFAVLAGVLLDRAWRTQERRTLLLSALMITAAAWTKLDGFYGGVLPWCIACFLIGRRRMAFVPLLLSLPWFIFISLADLPLSPNAAQFGFHPEAPWLVFEAMFLEMSFGMRWWAAVIVVGILVVRERWALLRDPLLQFGFIALSATIVNFVMTSDVLHLVTKVTFSRAMLTATFLLTAGLTLRFGNLVRAYTVSDKRNHQG